MAITFVDYAGATSGSSTTLDFLVPVGVSDGDVLVAGIQEYLPAVAAPTPPDVNAWSRVTTYHPGYAGKSMQVYVATYDSATMPVPGDPLTFSDSSGSSGTWAGFLACYHADGGFAPVEYCFRVQAAYYALNAPGTWSFQDWFDTDPAATPYGPYDEIKTDVLPEDMLLYVFGIMPVPSMGVPPVFHLPGAALPGDPPPAYIEWRGWETESAGVAASVVISLCDEFGSTVSPGVDARTWGFSYTGDIHTVGLRLREMSPATAGGWVVGHAAWGNSNAW